MFMRKVRRAEESRRAKSFLTVLLTRSTQSVQRMKVRIVGVAILPRRAGGTTITSTVPTKRKETRRKGPRRDTLELCQLLLPHNRAVVRRRVGPWRPWRTFHGRLLHRFYSLRV